MINKAAILVMAAAAVLQVSGCGGDVRISSGTGGQSGGGYHRDTPGGTQRIDKIDLLFDIDNSASMADKQAILADAVPDLVDRLTDPLCVSVTDGKVVGKAIGGSCPDGSEREFDPVNDIHIGVISSSIGGHGADSCADGSKGHPNDHAHFITRSLGGNDVTTWAGKGFLNWDPQGKASPPGESDMSTLVQTFTDIVRGADQDGCGFEAQLESWYRFLVDPKPYEKIVPKPCNSSDQEKQCRGPEGVDQTVLAQRADFLRADSLVAIVMLTDENDCSIKDSGRNYLAAQQLNGTHTFHLPHATDACATDPWSKECKSCGLVSASQYPECANKGWKDPDKDDAINLRCFNQKKRFGINFLQPIKRYVDGLTKRQFDDGSFNPLFCRDIQEKPDPNNPHKTVQVCGHVPRDADLVFFAGIVGVPWQDIARNPSDLRKGYLDAEQLAWRKSDFSKAGLAVPAGVDDSHDLWNVILGRTDPASHEIVPTVDPLDPLMKESVDPRTGTNPATGSTLGANNPVNSGEWNIVKRNDLQYACTFKLPTPIDCSKPGASWGCDCTNGKDTPLCNGSTQIAAKAYPGRRQLAVLQGIGDQAIVASVCPANITDKTADDYGYRPAIGAIVARLKGVLQGTCWGHKLQVKPDGTVDCIVLEATKGQDDGHGGYTCSPCDTGDGVRTDAPDGVLEVLSNDDAFRSANMHCVCQINQVAPDQLDNCVSAENSQEIKGWCYVDPSVNDKANRKLVDGCPEGARQMIRFGAGIGNDPNTLLYLACKD